MIYVNGRFLSQRLTGVQNFALYQLLELSNNSEICLLIPKCVDVNKIPDGIKYKIVGKRSGHYWEQIELGLFLIKENQPLLMTFSGLAPLFSKNSIFTIHDVSFKHNPKWFNFFYRTWYDFAYTLLIPKSKKIITVSNYSKNEILKFYPESKDKIKVIYNSIPSISVNIDVKNNINYGKFILLVSSIDPRKNIVKFIESFLLLNDTECKLIIVGGSAATFNKINIPSNSNIIFLGYVDNEELHNLYRTAIAFAYPSLYEGFGIPPLEAMSFGCPCIVSSSTSIPEACGDAAYYFDPSSQISITNAIKYILSSHIIREELITKGYKRLSILKKNNNRILGLLNENITG